jgi:hypothetical protein
VCDRGSEQIVDSEIARLAHSHEVTNWPRTRSLNCWSRPSTNTCAPFPAMQRARLAPPMPPPTITKSNGSDISPHRLHFAPEVCLASRDTYPLSRLYAPRACLLHFTKGMNGVAPS